jgi:DNA-binding NarL/FixJ family response regulator
MESIALSPVLVVDDEPAIQQRLVGVLRGVDATVEAACAGSLADARALLAQRDFALALVDIGLPDGNGCELVAWLHAHRPGIAVLVVSAWGHEDTVLAALRAGATGYLLKEREDIELAYALRSVQRGGAPIDPAIARRILALVPQDAPAGGHGEGGAVHLSTREREVLELMARGHSNREIADAIALSTLTIEGYTKAIYRKLAVGSRTAAVHEARNRGLLR